MKQVYGEEHQKLTIKLQEMALKTVRQVGEFGQKMV